MNILYITDLDGTILGKDGWLMESTKDKLKQLLDKGVPITYATARSYTSAHERLKEIPFRLPALTYNGCFLVDGGSGVVQQTEQFEKKALTNVIAIFSRYYICPLSYAMIEGKEKTSCYLEKSTKQVKKYMISKPHDARNRFVLSEESLYEGEIFYFTLIDTYSKLEPVYRDLLSYAEQYEKMYGQAPYQLTFQEEIYDPGDYWLEIMPATAGKAEGVRRLKKVLGCDKVVCFGDGKNDIEMFLAAEEGFAVENACEELKMIATGIIQSNTDNGVINYIWNNEKSKT
ncbi:hydrolase HAD superfamily [Lachnospiraceae bacterium KM106-2]|nr:hydrolase HAD superfamily [Lachnospiraceae bacterium KM106-2]